MDVGQLKDDFQAGRIGSERLFEVIEALSKRVERLEKKLQARAAGQPAEPFSLRAEEKRQEQRGRIKRRRKRRGRRGRVTTAEKIKLAERTEKCFPAGVAESDCWLSHTRVAWRLEDHRAVLVAYEIYRGPGGRYGKIPGVPDRGEFGLEILMAVSYHVHQVGLSFDKVCLVLGFFTNLSLKKSQIDALLTRLARHWEGEFERLCTLVAQAAIVHADETSWSLNSVWALLSEQARVLLFGVPKDAATLEKLLDPATFAGILISDDAAVYGNFTRAQKCWAHLLRKAIKLTLVAPDNAAYRRLADRLLEIYRAACRVQRDGRLTTRTRAAKVAELDDEVLELCGPVWFAELGTLDGPDNDYRLLCNELMKLLLEQELFTFVVAAPVSTPTGEAVAVAGTNNAAERTLRNPAQARGAGRTNKTPAGARRRTILVSVLESLRCFLPRVTLAAMIDEVCSWQRSGASCFARRLTELGLSTPARSILDELYPAPSG
jgi:transposase